jgi:hypothetical protein
MNLQLDEFSPRPPCKHSTELNRSLPSIPWQPLNLVLTPLLESIMASSYSNTLVF